MSPIVEEVLSTTNLGLPQVADLDQVLEVPTLIANGLRTDEEIAHHFRLGHDPRQGRYRLHAAERLGLIERIGVGKRVVTSLGRAIAATKGSSRGRLARKIIQNFAPAKLMLAILATEKAGLTVEDLTRRIALLPGFSGKVSTLSWRVGSMLRNWLVVTGFVVRSNGKFRLSPTGIKFAPRRIPPIVALKKRLIRGTIRHSPNRNVDIEMRRKIERAAIEAAAEYYVNQGFNVTTRELENVGWDLDVEDERISMTYKVEVKGTSLKQIIVLVSPNEYAQMKRNREVYRIVVVSNALVRPQLLEFAFDAQLKQWINADNQARLLIKEVKSATLSVG